ncbi:MAG TPA: hypothetical protein VNK43_05415 [Gemmatimonadales bacterium]|nr:hypothetical protein [Gemmatimonadales bacterium]
MGRRARRAARLGLALLAASPSAAAQTPLGEDPWVRPGLLRALVRHDACPVADSVLGRGGASPGETEAFYDPVADTTFIASPARGRGGRAVILVVRRPGTEPMPHPAVRLVLVIRMGHVELLRPHQRADERQLVIVLDDSLRLTPGTMRLAETPDVRAMRGPGAPVSLSISLGSASFAALARSGKSVLEVGGRTFTLTDEERADIRALYRAASCSPTRIFRDDVES